MTGFSIDDVLGDLNRDEHVWNKKCKICKQIKSSADFYSMLGNSDGKSHRCKECTKKQRKEHYEKNRDEVRGKAREKYWSDPEFYREKISAGNRERHKRLSDDPRYRFSRLIDKKRAADPECDLTLDYLMSLYERQNGRCVLTGRELTFGMAEGQQADMNAASLDRIDQNGGYRIGNVRLITSQANIARHRFSDADLIAFCYDVIATLGKPD